MDSFILSFLHCEMKFTSPSSRKANMGEFASTVMDVLVIVKAQLDIDRDNGRMRKKNINEQSDAFFDDCCRGKDIFG